MYGQRNGRAKIAGSSSSFFCDCAVCLEIFEDVDDPDRTDIPEVHIAFYFSKYFKRTLNPQVPSKLVKIIKFAAINPL